MSSALPQLADLTPEWIANLLRRHGFDVALSGVAAQPIGTGQVGATYRLTLDYARSAPGAPATLVAKLPSNDPLSKATGKSHLTYIRESRFYELFAGKKPMPVPDHLFIAFDEESHDFALIMHDLPRHVAGNQLSVPSAAEAGLAMDAAAAIHAAWWGDPLLDTLDWLNGTQAVPPPIDTEALYTMLWPAFCDRYGGRITEKMQRVGEAYYGRIKDWSEGSHGPRCLTHNDFRPDNMLFDLADPAKPIVVVDWQTVGVGMGAGDVAYYMGTAFEPHARADHEVALVARYREGLLRNGVNERETVDIWDLYRRSAFSGFLMGATAAMVVVQTDRGDSMFLAMCERSAAMVLDHADVALPAG
jgi:Phosphotransferase enzyme family